MQGADWSNNGSMTVSLEAQTELGTQDMRNVLSGMADGIASIRKTIPVEHVYFVGKHKHNL